MLLGLGLGTGLSSLPGDKDWDQQVSPQGTGGDHEDLLDCAGELVEA